MGMNTTIVYGYGFPVESKATCIEVLRFLKSHIPAIKAIYADVKPKNYENESISDLWEKYLIELEWTERDERKLMCNAKDCIQEILEENYPVFYDFACNYIEDMGSFYFFDVIVEIMKEETGIRFTFETGQSSDCNGEGSILFEESYPWFQTEAERKITSPDELASIMEPYARELGIRTNLINYQEVEYYG